MEENNIPETPVQQDAQQSSGTSQSYYRKSRAAAPVGAVVILLALVGVVSLITILVQWITGLQDNSSERGKLEQLILPVLMFDPISFDSVETADQGMVLQSSIWSTVLTAETGRYTFDIGETLTVPVTDIEIAAKKLFGPDVTLAHKTFGDVNVSYYYDEENQLYYVPIDGQIGFYTPRVEEIERKEGDIYRLKVGYVPPNNVWTSMTSSGETFREADKYMIYEVKKEKDSYYLLAIKDLEEEESSSIPAAL